MKAKLIALAPLVVLGLAACTIESEDPEAPTGAAPSAPMPTTTESADGGATASDGSTGATEAGQACSVPKTCASLAGSEGRCTSSTISGATALPQDICSDTERCAPCWDPVTGADTGACRTVACDAPKLPKVVYAECCKGLGTAKGRCIPTAQVKGTKRGLEIKECKGEAERCVPAETLSTAYVAPKCKGRAIVGTYDGVCISTCLRKDEFLGFGMGGGDCGADAFCAPCKDPITNVPTGAPGCN